LIATQDAVILVRHSYDEWVGFWPGSQIEPFATIINGVANFVIGPMIVGRGRRLFDGLPSIQLELIRSEISPTGYLLDDYRVIR
jgi:hypothetical protein